MCGIVGMYGFVDKNLLHKMMDIITYRGPDDSGIFEDSNIALGIRRLSIIDIEGGHQPIHNEDESIWIVFNGEIYNFKELRGELERKGHSFYTLTDTEVIVHLYEEFGENCVSYLRGMFAFAMWDANRKQLLLARDRLGIKPLYYLIMQDKLLFASEIKSLIQYKEFEKILNSEALRDFFTYKFIPNKHTPIMGIERLLPGYILTSDNFDIQEKKYWDIDFKSENSKSEEYYIELLKENLEESIKIRLISDVPLGAYLSGGIDSSTIVGIMSKFMEEPVKTFTIGYGNPDDEYHYARIVSEQFGTDHHELIMDYDVMLKSLPEIIWYMDEPSSDFAMFPLYFLSKFAKRYVTVSLLGEGSDEIFSGYLHYKIASNRFDLIPETLKKRIYTKYMTFFSNEEINKLLNENFQGENELEKYLNKNDIDFLNRILLFDIKNELPDWQLRRVDRMTMAASLEARVPFLDHKLVEFSSKLPTKLKLNGFTDKYILRKVAKEILPKRIYKRRKTPFILPLRDWLGGELGQVIEDTLYKSKIFDKNFVKRFSERVKNEFNPIRRDNLSHKQLSLFIAEAWKRMYIDDEKSL
jgi:asparagine synthase (glutamine-hydrolysing)